VQLLRRAWRRPRDEAPFGCLAVRLVFMGGLARCQRVGERRALLQKRRVARAPTAPNCAA
jgi:hypothetical protein